MKRNNHGKTKRRIEKKNKAYCSSGGCGLQSSLPLFFFSFFFLFFFFFFFFFSLFFFLLFYSCCVSFSYHCQGLPFIISIGDRSIVMAQHGRFPFKKKLAEFFLSCYLEFLFYYCYEKKRENFIHMVN